MSMQKLLLGQTEVLVKTVKKVEIEAVAAKALQSSKS